MNQLEASVAKDEKLLDSLLHLEPVFLLECAQDLAASARYLKVLRETEAELRPVDAEYVAGRIGRVMTQAMQHLDEAGFNRAYDAYHQRLTEEIAESPEKLIAEHDCGILEGLMTEKVKSDIAEAVRERNWTWFWNGMGRLKAPGKSFSRVAEFARNTRDHWLLRPVAIGGGFMVDAANMAGEVIDLCQAEISVHGLLQRIPDRPDVIVRIGASLGSVTLGLSDRAAVHLQTERGELASLNKCKVGSVR